MIPFLSTTLKTLGAIALAACLSTGCGYTHDTATYFTETWETDYVELHGCRLTAHPRGGYMRVVMSPEAQAAWCAEQELPEGTVVVKEQWDDNAACPPNEWDLFTVMKKTSAGWDWQTVGGTGGVQGTSGQNTGCIDCHQGSCGDDLLCTDRQALGTTATISCP